MKGRKRTKTYPNNGRVVGHSRRLVLLGARVFLNAKVFHIAASEDDIFVDLVGRADLLIATLSPFGAKRTNIFEGNGRVVRVDLMEDTDIAGQAVSKS